MQFDIGMTPPSPKKPAVVASDLVELLQQMLTVQREHLEHAKAVAAANDHGARWRAMVGRWKQELPDLPATCKEVLPALERCYGEMIARLVDELREQGDEALENDFAVQDFLDRYGMRLGQLGHILNLVAPLADAAAQNEEGSAQEKPQ